MQIWKKEIKSHVIIANYLQPEQEARFFSLLWGNKKAIGWTLADIIGINPSICIHKILLENEAKTITQS